MWTVHRLSKPWLLTVYNLRNGYLKIYACRLKHCEYGYHSREDTNFAVRLTTGYRVQKAIHNLDVNFLFRCQFPFELSGLCCLISYPRHLQPKQTTQYHQIEYALQCKANLLWELPSPLKHPNFVLLSTHRTLFLRQFTHITLALQLSKILP